MAAHEMKIRTIKTISDGTKEILLRRAKKPDLEELFKSHSSLALIHGDVCDMIYASDLAQKAASVEVFEVSGTCPQHMTCLAILGDTSAVDAAVRKVKEELLD